MTDLNLIPTTGAPVGFPFMENHVRARLGIGKDEIRSLRQQHLVENTDWLLKKKRIWLAALGVEKLCAAKGLEPKFASPNAQTANAVDAGAIPAAPPTGPIPKKNAALKAKPAEPIKLIVVQRCVNPHMIQACDPKDDPIMPKKMVRVRVRSNENFTRHMEIPAVLVAGYTDLYDLARACPKKKGKW